MRLRINAEIKQGDFIFRIDTELSKSRIGIFGPSGAGKSTLLHLISGLKRADRAYISLNDRVLADTEKNIFVSPDKRGVGVVFQDSRLFPHMTVKKNLQFGMKSKAKSSISFQSVVETLELAHLLNRRPANLSGGERQRVAIGRALLSSPELLLFDEPFSAIDTTMRRELLQFISRINNTFDIPLLMISHDLPELLHLTDYLLLIKNGEVEGQGTCRELIFSSYRPASLLEAGASSTFTGKILARNRTDGTARIVTATEEVSNERPVEILGSYTESVEAGEFVKGSISPKDIIISAGPVEYISAQNQLRGVITRTRSLRDRILLEVSSGNLKLITEVTNKANTDFLYSRGREIWIIFKAHSVSYTIENGCRLHIPSIPAHTKTSHTSSGNFNHKINHITTTIIH